MSKTFINSSTLFTIPSVFKGAARVVDLSGYLDDYSYKKTEAEADREALRRDWNVVGLDIKKAIEDYEKGEQTNFTSSSSTTRSAT